MTPERWQRVQQLFHDALERSPDERTAFVVAASGDDIGLRSAAERMLAADAVASDLFDELPGGLLPAPDAEPGCPQGLHIGVYRIVRTLGSGGMGTVYLAEREDVGKQVAVKVVRGGLGAPEYRQRLLVERRVLARLEHPHITRLLDAGITPDGLPYFVMELVHGEPIDDYADSRQLTVAARLDLFAQVASAVQYAHQNLIVHRDLKPSNILVDASGTAKLLDFGIAKLLTGSGEDDNGITAPGLRPMTPQYAAPEQLRGDPVTTATDVYALGMLLYELLTGRRPYRPGTASPVAWAREIVESEPICPSSRVNEPDDDADGTPDIERDRVSASRGTTARALGRMLRGDLDTIVLKALEKDPARRYASVQQLLDDVDRYRQGRPIAAKPATWSYRCAKFVKRHPFSLGAAATAFALLVGLGIAVGFERAAQQRARTEAERAREATALLTDLFGRGNPRYSMGRFADTSGLLAWGERRAEALAGQPAIQAQVLSGIAETYTSLGIRARAQPLFERVLAILRGLHPGDDADVATALFWIGLMHVDAAEFDEAERIMNESLGMRRRLLAPNDPLVAEGIGVIAAPLLDSGHAEAAEMKFREALQIVPDGFTSSRHRLPNLHTALAAALLAEGGHAREAETEAREGLRATRARLGDEHVWFTVGQIQLARAFQQQGRLAEADSLFREAVEKSARAYGPDHPRLTVFLTFYASLLLERGDAANAEAVARRAFEIQQRVMPAEHYLMLKTRVVLGRILIERGRPAEAEPILREGVTGGERLLKPDHPDLAQARVALGTCLVAMGKQDEGEPLLASALATNDALTREARQGLERLRRSH